MGDAPVLSAVESAGHRGREAFWAGRARTDCPFPPLSPESMSWLEAFDAARQVRIFLDQHLHREA